MYQGCIHWLDHGLLETTDGLHPIHSNRRLQGRSFGARLAFLLRCLHLTSFHVRLDWDLGLGKSHRSSVSLRPLTRFKVAQHVLLQDSTIPAGTLDIAQANLWSRWKHLASMWALNEKNIITLCSAAILRTAGVVSTFSIGNWRLSSLSPKGMASFSCSSSTGPP